jgi:hypothetical protein
LPPIGMLQHKLLNRFGPERASAHRTFPDEGNYCPLRYG